MVFNFKLGTERDTTQNFDYRLKKSVLVILARHSVLTPLWWLRRMIESLLSFLFHFLEISFFFFLFWDNLSCLVHLDLSMIFFMILVYTLIDFWARLKFRKNDFHFLTQNGLTRNHLGLYLAIFGIYINNGLSSQESSFVL